MPNELAFRLADLLDDQELRDLLATAENPGASASAFEAWALAHREQILAHVRAALPPLPSIESALPVAAGPEGWRPRVSVGVATVGIDAPAATVVVHGQTVSLGLLPPDGAVLSLNAGPVAGGGAVSRRSPSEWGGALGLQLGAFQVNGVALLDRGDGHVSLVVVVGIRFLPPIQLSFGFALSAVGGVIGVNRTIDSDALRARLADGSALDALFPSDPIAGAARLLAALAGIFPPTPGQHVVGPTFTITWLDIGFTSIVRIDLGLLLQLPDPKVVIVGRAQISLPPILALRLDVVGEVDPARKVIAIDAVLVDSRALAIFRVTGTATFRLGWGNPPHVVAALGGFYPGYKPEPATIPPQQRLGLAIDIPCPLTIRALGYLAITSNTFQAGVDLEVGIDLEVISAGGFLRFDAIIEFDPFHIHVDYAAGWHVEVLIFEGGTTVKGWIDGPGPWAVHAEVSISLLLDDFEWSDTFIFGPQGPPRDPPIPQLADVLRPTINSPAHVRSSGGIDRDIRIRPRPGGLPDGMALVSPLATLEWVQTVVPLDLPVVRAQGRKLASEQHLTVKVTSGAVTAMETAEDWFAPGTYLDLTAAEALSLPPFQLLAAGRRLRLGPDLGAAETETLDYQTFIRRDAATWGPAGAGLEVAITLPLRAHTMALGLAAAPVVAMREPVVAVYPERWSVTRPGTTMSEPSAAHAFVTARHSGWVAHASADVALDVGVI